MKALVREAMREGAVGVSTSLQYPPAPYARTEELIALATRGGPKYGGIYATHMRSEGDAISQALDEAIRIGREADIPVEIWHLKAAGKQNWGRMPEIVAKIDSARGARASTSRPTPTPIRPGSTRCRRSCRPGRTTAATPSWSSGCRIRRPARASARDMLTPSDALGQRVAGDPRAGRRC